MNLTGLRELLDEHSAQLPTVAQQRVAAVGERIRRLRRRRVVAVAAVVLAVLLAAGAPLALARGTGLPPQPTASPSSSYRLIDGFPEYALGAKVAATATGPLTVGQALTVTVPGSSLGLTFTDRCEPATPDLAITVHWSVNGHGVSTGTCGGSDRPESMVPFGAGDGEQAVVTAAVVAIGTSPAPGAGDRTSAPGTFAIAVRIRIPFEQYPLPPRPATLRPLDGPDVPGNVLPGFDPGAQVIDSDPADPRATRTVTLTPGLGTSLDMVSQTPGYLTVQLDGVVLATGEWWDYDVSLYHATLPASASSGAHTLTITAARLTGAWRVVIHSSDR